jgi:sugar fermentation stimulation protein A
VTYPAPLRAGVLLRRYKRFFADVEVDGQVLVAHCPNTGSMRNCIGERSPCRISAAQNPKRKLGWTLEQVCVDGRWIMVNTHRANQVVEEALRAGYVEPLADYGTVEREKRLGESRIDFRLSGPSGTCWVEVKNVTLFEQGDAMFPDSVTKRGAKHLAELSAAKRNGDRAVMLFHVGMTSGAVVRPAEHLDPAYAAALRQAVAVGVEVMAYRTSMSTTELRLDERMDVRL